MIKKIDVIIIIAVILVASIFFYKAGYFNPQEERPTPQVFPPPNETISRVPSPPPSVILPGRRTITSEDEGCHYKSLIVGREWWYFTALLNGKRSELKNWTVVISFNHMAYGDLFGELKPDVLVAVLSDDKGNTYGGLINKKRGTLDATTPGVDVTFEKSWIQGEYPRWHVHIESKELDEKHDIVMDLDYFATSLPLWIYDTRILNNSNSKIASYIFLGCNVTGTIILDGIKYQVEGIGDHEHAWSPIYVRKSFIDGWDWFHIYLDNGWQIYVSKFYPTPQSITSNLHRAIPFGTIFLTPDGESITEFSVFDLNPKQKEKIFMFTKFPTSFSLSANRKYNILLQRIDLKLNIDISTDNTYQHVWKFPTYVGIKVGTCKASGSISWTDGEKDYNLDLKGKGIVWTTRALP